MRTGIKNRPTLSCRRTGQRRRFFEVGFRSSLSCGLRLQLSLLAGLEQQRHSNGAGSSWQSRMWLPWVGAVDCCFGSWRRCVALTPLIYTQSAGMIFRRAAILSPLSHPLAVGCLSSTRGTEAAWADGGPKFTCSRR